MQIIGFNLTKILAERKEKLNGKLEIKQNIIKMRFSYRIKYYV